MRNPPTISSPVLGAKIHNGISSIPHTAAKIITRRRPHFCDQKPRIVPPQIAPVAYTMLMIDFAFTPKPRCSSKYVG
jgi:hypothetical protein